MLRDTNDLIDMAVEQGANALTTEIVWLAPAGALLIGYLLGSIPFGVVLTRMGGAGDLRTIGSGNIGATNVLRTGRKGLAAATLLLDVTKGAAAVWLIATIWPGEQLIAGIAAFLGHLYPIWLGMRGGKGVATYLGIAAALDWIVGLAFAAAWLAALALSRRSSVGGMVAAIIAPVAAALGGRFDLVMPMVAMTLLLLWKHRDNIDRLLEGTEPRIGSRG